MITKAIIEKEINSKTYTIRIPTIDKISSSSTASNEVQTATVSSQINSPMNLTAGDIVFVDFEENSYLNPVILGILYTKNNLKSKPDILLNSIEVKNSAKLPQDTKIGDITYSEIVCLKNVRANIQKQIDEIYESLKEKINSIDEKKSILHTDLGTEQTELFVAGTDSYINKVQSIVGNQSDVPTNTIFGNLNYISARLNYLLSIVGTVDEDKSFFGIIEDLTTRLIELEEISNTIGDSSSNNNSLGDSSRQVSSTPYSQQQSSNFDNLLLCLRRKFPDGKYWNHMPKNGTGSLYNNQDGYTDIPCTKHNNYCGTAKQTCNGYAPNGKEVSWQCDGYANKCGYDMTGYDPIKSSKWVKTEDSNYLNNLKKGDIVKYKNSGHTIFVTDVKGEVVTYTDCNSDGHCIIRWDAKIKKETLKKTFSYARICPQDFSMSRLHI